MEKSCMIKGQTSLHGVYTDPDLRLHIHVNSLGYFSLFMSQRPHIMMLSLTNIMVSAPCFLLHLFWVCVLAHFPVRNIFLLIEGITCHLFPSYSTRSTAFTASLCLPDPALTLIASNPLSCMPWFTYMIYMYLHCFSLHCHHCTCALHLHLWFSYANKVWGLYSLLKPKKDLVNTILWSNLFHLVLSISNIDPSHNLFIWHLLWISFYLTASHEIHLLRISHMLPPIPPLLHCLSYLDSSLLCLLNAWESIVVNF